MLGPVGDYLSDLWLSLRLADVADVLVVSTFIYVALRWIRQSRSRFVMSGVVVLVGLYFAARLLDMYLTLFVFQVGLTVAVVALVVIFQEDIRRAFERIALRRPRERPLPVEYALVDQVVSSVSELANHRVGALLVFRGKEPLERHLTGGVRLDGQLSPALLYSIFDDSSAGHDGAVVIENGLITKFAAHLPLSTHVAHDARMGTRHTAALGLSECSDALIVVVSEERGTISLAKGGSLEVVSPGELKGRLSEFTGALHKRSGNALSGLFTKNLGSKVLALGLSLLAWLLVFGYQTDLVARTYSLPISYTNVPSDWQLDDPDPLEARVTLSGSSRAFRLLDPGKLGIAIDVSEVRSGLNVHPLTAREVKHPADLTVQSVEPSSAKLAAYETMEIELKVRPRISGSLPARLVSVDPATVHVLVRKRDQKRFAFVETERVDASELKESGSLERSLAFPENMRAASSTPDSVSIRYTASGL